VAKLYFYYSSMNAGKSTTLLQSAHNYRERGLTPLLFTPQLDTRAGTGRIASRIGLETDARAFTPADDLHQLTTAAGAVDCVLIDEAQFLTRAQVYQLGEVADRLNVPVLAYGLRTDFQGNLFEGSQQLLAWADKLIEIKTICHCGRKATMVLRTDEVGNVVREGEQVEIGGNDRYTSVCRKCFKRGMANTQPGDLPL
jgi:thymidine kinase